MHIITAKIGRNLWYITFMRVWMCYIKARVITELIIFRIQVLMLRLKETVVKATVIRITAEIEREALVRTYAEHVFFI